jgi:hypothetical protein
MTNQQQEEVYQDNGFELVVYRQRQPDAYTPCPVCERPQHHLATVYDEWEQGRSATAYYYYCKRCQQINRISRRDRLHDTTTEVAELYQAPYELLVELLAGARSQAGRGVTVLTINEQWWTPRRYPLAKGEVMQTGPAHVRPAHSSGVPGDHRLVDEGAPRVTPMPRYSPPSAPQNPFTSRPLKSSTERNEQTPDDPTSEYDEETPED